MFRSNREYNQFRFCNKNVSRQRSFKDLASLLAYMSEVAHITEIPSSVFWSSREWVGIEHNPRETVIICIVHWWLGLRFQDVYRSHWYTGIPVYRSTGIQVYRSTGIPGNGIMLYTIKLGRISRWKDPHPLKKMANKCINLREHVKKFHS